MKYIYWFLVFFCNLSGMEEQLNYRGVILPMNACTKAFVRFDQYDIKMRQQSGQGISLTRCQKRKRAQLEKQWGEEVGKILRRCNKAPAMSPNN